MCMACACPGEWMVAIRPAPATPQLEDRHFLERLSRHAESGLTACIPGVHGSLHLDHEPFVDGAIRVVSVWPNQGVATQFHPLRDAEHHAESFRVAHGGGVRVSECVDIEPKRLLQHLPGQLDIINIERADTTRPKDNTEVVIRARSPERFSFRGIREIATRACSIRPPSAPSHPVR